MLYVTGIALILSGAAAIALQIMDVDHVLQLISIVVLGTICCSGSMISFIQRTSPGPHAFSASQKYCR